VWPDNGVPSPLDPLVRFVRQVRHEMNRFPNAGPTTIHCSAGVGRTGTFVGIDRLLQDYNNKSYVDIFGMVHEMRMSRCLMVQTEVNYQKLFAKLR
jgi:protein tyrosine phosphatase